MRGKPEGLARETHLQACRAEVGPARFISAAARR